MDSPFRNTLYMRSPFSRMGGVATSPPPVPSGPSPADLFVTGKNGAWYDPSDLSTLFQDAAGSVPVTSDGDPVGRILDKSGNNNHATQSVSATRPTYRTDGALHWLDGDGLDDGLVSVNFAISPGVIAIGGVEPTFTGTSRNGPWVSLGARVSNYYGGLPPNNDAYLSFGSSERPAVLGELVPTGRHVATVTHDGSDIVLSSNQVELGRKTAAFSPTAEGQSLAILETHEGNSFFEGKLFGLVLVAEGISPAERDTAEQWAADKGGVAL